MHRDLQCKDPYTIVAEILLPDARKWSESSCGTVVVLLRPTASAVIRGRPGICLLDKQSSDWYWRQSRWTTLRDTLWRLAAPAYDNSISIHPTARHLNKSGKRFLLDIARLYWLLSRKLRQSLKIIKPYTRNYENVIFAYIFLIHYTYSFPWNKGGNYRINYF